ncbi:MAG: phospholipase D family protein [Paracoccus sp. (in: a-proteobacteria)]
MIWIILVGAALWFAGRYLFPVPSTEGRAEELSLLFDPTTTLAPEAIEAQSAHPGQSGVIPLPNGQAAFLSRIALAGAAERSIDAMYYIWHDDESGLLLMQALREAAERGVRVRLLLDDNGIGGLDPILAAMNAQPNFSVRLFNPSTVRNPKALGYVLYPLRMNRRMHYKALIVDGAAAIVGGRNIGNEYFSVGDAPAYLDLDVLGVGSVVSDTAAVFDEYWNSAPVLELDKVITGEGDLAGFDAMVAEARTSEAGKAIGDVALSAAAMMADGNAPPLEWTDVQVVADNPLKGLGEANKEDLMIYRLADLLGGVQSRLDLISAYFVPGKVGSEYFGKLAESGIRVSIMTNSWEATDVPLVHAGYIKYRRELLESGGTLYELKPIDGMAQGQDELNFFGSSGASLHAKTFSVDDARIFIGSFNFDPRSASLNCEMGFLIDSPSMAKEGSLALEDDLSKRSFQPMLEEDGDMVWKDPQPDGSAIIHEKEPGLGTFDRIMVYVLNVLPIEWTI